MSTVINEDNQTHTKSKDQLVSKKAIIKIHNMSTCRNQKTCKVKQQT
jgi:hypothetical protein